MKKFLILVLTIIMCCNIIACGSSKEPTIDSETITVDYETITDDISTAVLAMDNCARIQKQWLGVSNNLPYLYSDTNYTGGNNDEAKEAGTDCYKFRTVAIEKMEAAKTSLKGGSGDYHNAVQEYYLAANAYLNFISNFPEGHTKTTWAQKWTELQQSCDTAVGKIELYK